MLGSEWRIAMASNSARSRKHVRCAEQNTCGAWIAHRHGRDDFARGSCTKYSAWMAVQNPFSNELLIGTATARSHK